MQFNESPRQREANAEAALHAVEGARALCEQIEDARQERFVDSDILLTEELVAR